MTAGLKESYRKAQGSVRSLPEGDSDEDVDVRTLLKTLGVSEPDPITDVAWRGEAENTAYTISEQGNEQQPRLLHPPVRPLTRSGFLIATPSPAASTVAQYSCVDIDHSYWHHNAQTARDNHRERLLVAPAALSTQQGSNIDYIPAKDPNQPWPHQSEASDPQVGSNLSPGTGESTKDPFGTPVDMSEAATGTPCISPYATGTVCTWTSALIEDSEPRFIRSNVQCGSTSRHNGKIYDNLSEILDTAMAAVFSTGL